MEKILADILVAIWLFLKAVFFPAMLCMVGGLIAAGLYEGIKQDIAKAVVDRLKKER